MSERKTCPIREVANSIWMRMSPCSTCLEDKCAMWRLYGGGYFAVNPPDDLKAMMDEAASKIVPIGYCGLAGKP